MNREDVVALMRSSKTAKEWDNNCDHVKRELGGYPAYWYEAILASGLAREVFATFGETPNVKVRIVSGKW
jgi:hypothetical protein